MTGNPDKSLTIDTHHHILQDFFWRETNDSHVPVGGLAPLQWSKEAMISFLDDAGIDVAVMSVGNVDCPSEPIELKETMLRIAIIIGSTRPVRKGEAAARWAYDMARTRTDAEFELVDIAESNLPFLTRRSMSITCSTN